jgi:hypothetical protein
MSKIRLHGSSSGYTEIAPVAASGNNTLTLPNDGTIISHDSAGAIGITSVRATNAHFSGTTRVTTGITTTATITTAKVTTIQDASGGNSSTPEQIEGGRAKAWCNLNGTGTIAVRDSFGLSSVTDTAQAKYQFNFSTAFANTNYCVLTGQNRKADNDGDDRFFTKSYNYNTTDFRVEHAFAANDTQNSDSEYVFIAVMA